MTIEAKIEAAIESLVPDLKGIVKEIEGGHKTTQNHYGRYMSLISKLGGDSRAMRNIVGLALIRAGANRAGVDSALRLS